MGLSTCLNVHFEVSIVIQEDIHLCKIVVTSTPSSEIINHWDLQENKQPGLFYRLLILGALTNLPIMYAVWTFE